MSARILFSLLFAVLFIGQAHSQYRRSNPFYGRPATAIPHSQDPKEEPKNLTAEEIVEQQMPRIMEVVELNAFEEAVVSSIMVKYVQKTLEVQILELGKNETQEAVEKIKRDQRAELEAGLPPEKFEAIMTLQEEGFRKAKKKKKKKKKKKDS